MYQVGKIDRKYFENQFGELQTDEVVVTDERIVHIKEHHPEDYILFQEYGTICLTSPDWIITDEQNPGTVYMVKKMENTNLNVVLRLALSTDAEGIKNSVMTFWRIRDKNVRKLAGKNKILYKRG